MFPFRNGAKPGTDRKYLYAYVIVEYGHNTAGSAFKHWCPAGNIDRMRFMLELLFVSKSASINLKTRGVTRRVADMAGTEERPRERGDDEKVKYPVGFRFDPTLKELVEFYLLPRLLDRPTVPNDAVIEADAYECDPEILTKRYEERGEDDTWYFLSPRSRRYPGGDRPTRRTADNRGRWKPSTGQSKPGKDAAAAGHSKAKKGVRKDLSVGEFEFTENTLAYYVGDPTNETKTKWLMLEITVPEPEKKRDADSSTAAEKPRDHMLLNKYVICKIYKSPLKKWKEVEKEEGGTSSASACDDEVPTSSQSGTAPEGSGEASALTPVSSKCAGKRPAPEQPTSEQANAPNKRASLMPPAGTPVPTTHANGGGMRAPPVGVGAAGYYDHNGAPVHLPPLMQWPPAMYSSMQGPVQMQRRPPSMYAHNGQPPVQMQRRPPSMYAHNGQPPVQGPPVQMQRRPPSMYARNGQQQVQGAPVLKLYPPHRAAATALNSFGQTVPTRPLNQPVRPPSSFPRPPSQQQQMEDMMLQQRVYAQLVAEMKLQKRLQESASCAGQQQQIKTMPTASTQPACFNEGANRAAGTKFMVPQTQLPAPHHNSNFYPCSGVQQQQQQSSPAIPAANLPPGAAAPVQVTTPAADEAPGNKLPMQGDANEGTGNGDCYDYRKQPCADLADVKN